LENHDADVITDCVVTTGTRKPRVNTEVPGMMEQGMKSSRRSLLKGVLGGTGALVLGFDPVHRSWVTSAFADSPVIAIPDLDGVLRTDAATLAAFADDFGHIVHRTPIAVLQPASVEDVVNAVRFCRRHDIQVVARGQGHSTGGQTQVQGGLVIDSSTLNAIEHIGPEHATVQAGLRWKDLLATSIPLGLAPPALTGFVGLSIGGTLSMGGIGAAGFRKGAQVDNVLELDVVTGEGELKTCSPERNALLFNAVLGGVGQYGVIVRAKLPMVPAPPNARNYIIPYTDAGVFFADMHTLTSGGKIDGVYGQIAPDGHGGWVYLINAVKFFASSPPDDAVILAGLNFPPPALQATNMDTFSYYTFVDNLIAFLQSIGLLNIPHVWGDVFLPASRTPAFVQSSLAALTPADLGPAGFVLLFPLRNAHGVDVGDREDDSSAPLAFRLPREQTVFLFDVLTSGSPSDPNYASTQLAKARARFEAARAIGGTLYPIGSTPMSKADWAAQYGFIFPLLRRAKELYDPEHIMTPGAGIF
jgi:cytokinin dehydrogenase